MTDQPNTPTTEQHGVVLVVARSLDLTAFQALAGRRLVLAGTVDAAVAELEQHPIDLLVAILTPEEDSNLLRALALRASARRLPALIFVSDRDDSEIADAAMLVALAAHIVPSIDLAAAVYALSGVPGAREHGLPSLSPVHEEADILLNVLYGDDEADK